jgi:glycosidase
VQRDAVGFDADLHAHYRRCIALRHALPVLRTGTVETVLSDDAHGVLVQRRVDGEAQAMVALNRGGIACTIVLPAQGASAWRDRFHNGALHPAPNGEWTVTLAPLSGSVWAPV